jgi:hypothetical protein
VLINATIFTASSSTPRFDGASESAIGIAPVIQAWMDG